MPPRFGRATPVALSACCGLALLLTAAGCGCGCGGSNAPPEPDAVSKERDKLSDLQNKTNGDWNKLSQADKDYVLQLAHGSEYTARMLFNPKSGGGGRPQTPGAHPTMQPAAPAGTGSGTTAGK